MGSEMEDCLIALLVLLLSELSFRLEMADADETGIGKILSKDPYRPSHNRLTTPVVIWSVFRENK